MSHSDGRQKDILLMLLALQLSVLVVIAQGLIPLLFVAGLLVLNVVFNETIRRLEEYAGR